VCSSLQKGTRIGGGKMTKKSKVEELTDFLKDLEASTPDVEASAVVSVDGLMIASALPQDVEGDRVAAMSAAMLSLGERTASELARGDLSEVYVKGENGYVLLMSAGENAVLTALARKDAKLGLVFLDMKRTAEHVSERV
jgi:predicted regulator of Ras-like GTPase activity (Roadblock/LC7/MglB family)